MTIGTCLHSMPNNLLSLFLQEKLKEKKPALTESLIQTLQAMHKAGCLSLSDVIEGDSSILVRFIQ